MKTKILLSFFIFSTLWGVIFFYVFFSIITESPLKPENTISIKYYLPEGWGFFTKTPRENNIYIYKKNKNKKLVLFQEANGSLKNLLGLKKTSRATSAEYGRILNNLTPKWTPFKGGDNIRNIADTIKAIEFKNNENKPLLEGEVILVAFKPIPWAWANDFNMDNREGQMVKINISCSK